MSLPRSARLLVVIAATCAAIVFTACGGGSSTPASTGAAASGTATQASATSSTGSTSDGSTSSSSGGGGTGATGGGTLSSRASGALDQDFTISYSMNGPSGAATAMTIYWDAAGKNWRVDTKSSAGTITLMNQGNATIYCLDTQKTCTKSSAYGTQTSQIPFFSQGLDQPNALATEVTGQLGTDVTTSSKSIAGLDATCYDAASGAASGEVCFSPDDLILAWTGSLGGQQIGLEATKVEDSVRAKDFQPPYKLTSLPGGVLPP